MQSGCILHEEEVAQLVKSSSPNALRLHHPGERYQDWIDAHPDLAKSGWMLDIWGGGYPVHFRDAP